MTLSILEHFWAQVLWRPTKRMRALIFFDNLRKSKVCNLDVPIHIDKDVFGLYVTVDNVFIVQVLKSEQNLAHVELCKFFGEFVALQQVTKKFTACTDIHYEEKLLVGLECPVKLN